MPVSNPNFPRLLHSLSGSAHTVPMKLPGRPSVAGFLQAAVSRGEAEPLRHALRS